MKHLSQFCALFCILTIALALGACTLKSPGAAAEPAETSQPPQTDADLEAVLQVPITLPAANSVELEFTLINQSETGLYILKWYTPLEGLGGEIFRIERDGQPIPYEGPLAMRGDPTPDAYVFLDAGASVSATVDLAAAYDFSEPGEYTIAFTSPRISHVARTKDQMAGSVDDLGPIQMPSNSVVVEIQSAAGCLTGAGPATLPGRNQLVTTPTVSVVKVRKVPTFTLAVPPEPAAIEEAIATGERVEVSEFKLTVEEYPIVATGVYTPDRLEYTRLISPTILARRQAWRNLPPDKVVESTNQVLVKFGYRLEHNPIKSSYEYRLYQGDTLVQDQIYGFRYVTVNQRGDDFALPLQTMTDGNVLVHRDRIEPRIPGPITYMPIFWGNELLTVHTDRSQVLVQQGDKAIYTIPVEFAVADPVKGLWAWEGHWVLEVDGQVVVDGKSLNEEQGYDEMFGWRPLNGQPFYFFKVGDRIGVSYADEVLPYQYEEVIHYRCCEPAAFNVGNSEVMVWFHALKNGMWHYVEMGIY